MKVENNKQTPKNQGFYKVEYSDGNTGEEYFNGNYWMVEYAHPVKYWYTNNK